MTRTEYEELSARVLAFLEKTNDQFYQIKQADGHAKIDLKEMEEIMRCSAELISELEEKAGLQPRSKSERDIESDEESDGPNAEV